MKIKQNHLNLNKHHKTDLRKQKEKEKQPRNINLEDKRILRKKIIENLN